MTHIPFNRATRIDGELDALQDAYLSPKISGDGPCGKLAEELLQRELQCERVLLTTSCTHALEMAGILLDIEPGDEVIVPSFTFVTSALAFVMAGATPVFADIRADTLNIDEEKLESLITPRTRAVVVVHYAGVACEMDAIQALCDQHDLILIEDNAHGLFGRYRDRWLGTFGSLATQSFHETKNFSCGEGGALIVNDSSLVDRAEIIREKGTDRSRFFRGQVDKYSWVDKGSSYVLSDLLAALLLTQLRSHDSIQSKRRTIWQRYDNELVDWSQQYGVQQPHVPGHCGQAFHMYYLLMPDEACRDSLIDFLAEQDINAVFHYQPLNRSKMGLALKGDANACPISADVASRLVRLPFFTNLTEAQQSRVIETVSEFRPAGRNQAKRSRPE